MLSSIRGDGPYINHAMAVAESTMTCVMARESAYSGMELTWDMMMNSKLDLQPKNFDYKLKMDVPPLPVRASTNSSELMTAPLPRGHPVAAR